MKKRVFYVINLDRSRIWVLATLLVSILLFAFATGFRVGAARSSGPAGSPELSAGALEQLQQSEAMDLAELGPTTGSIDGESDEVGQDTDAQTADDLNTTAAGPGDSPFEKNREREGSYNGVIDSSSGYDDADYGDDRARTETAHVTKKKSEPVKSKKSVEKQVASQSKKEKTKTTTLAAKSKTTAQKKGNAVESRTAEKKSNAPEQKKIAALASDAKQENPRSVLLDTNSDRLRMSNISKESPAQTEQTTPAKSNTRTYSLQLGAFSSEAAADRMATTLKKQGFHPHIVKSRDRFIVRVGKSDTSKGLWELESGLRKNQYAPMRVSFDSAQ